jgi:mRNA interferase RelE/StbE
MRHVNFSSYSKKFIKKNKSLNPQLLKKIAKVIEELLKDPTPGGSKKLVGYEFYRVRIGNYRIVYKYDEKFLYVTIIDKRGQVYNKLKNM